MKEQLKHLIESTSQAFLSSDNNRNDFYDFTLSLVAWRAFSANFNGKRKPSDKKIISPGPQFQFDLVMKHIGDTGHRERVDESLVTWEKENYAALRGLLAIDRKITRNIPKHIWDYICRSWVAFFSTAQAEHLSSDDLMSLVLDQLQLSLSQDQLILEKYAPKELIGLMVNFLESDQSKNLYDPYCGSGALLSLGAQQIKGLKSIQGFATAGLPWKLANLRLLVLSLPVDVRIEAGLVDRYKLPDGLGFDIILMNPPYGRGEPSRLLPGEEGFWAELAHSSNRIDLAFVCHCLDRLSADGNASILLPGIFLSGQGALHDFRWRVIQRNLLDAVITLPAGVFPQTGVSTNILLFKKKKHNDKVFMLDATTLVQKSTSGVCLDEAAINEYITRRRKRDFKPDNHCLIVSNSDIAAQNFDLKFTSYIRADRGLLNPFLSSDILREECARLSGEYQKTEQKIKQLIDDKGRTNSK